MIDDDIYQNDNDVPDLSDITFAMMAKHREEGLVESDEERVIEACAESNDPEAIEEAVGLLSTFRDLDTDDIHERIEAERLDGIRVQEIRWVNDWDGSAKRFEFDLSAWDGSDVTMELTPDEVMSDYQFRRNLLSSTGILLDSFGDWSGQWRRYIHENDMVRVDPEPVEAESEAVENLLLQIGTKEVVEDREKFGTSPETYAFLDGDGDTLYIAGSVVDHARENSSGDVTPQKVRREVDHLMTGDAKRMRVDGKRIRVWPFSKPLLEDEIRLYYGGDDE